MPKKQQEKEPLVASDRFKTALMVVMLTKEGGVSVKELAAELNWKENSVRGAISAIIKKKMGLTITTEIRDGIRYYHIIPPKLD